MSGPFAISGSTYRSQGGVDARDYCYGDKSYHAGDQYYDGRLDELRGAHPIVDKVLQYRELTKLKSPYLDALPDLVNPDTGRIHTSYNQVGSATGRFSSSDPNLQNIPIRTELGRQVRRAFLAQPGWSLLAADYSQVELRILAHLSKDPALLEAFHRDEDIHSATASQVYGVEMGDVTPDMRRLAKVMNFGIIYGLSAHGMAQQTDLDMHQSAEFIEGYFAKYPGISEYIEKVKAKKRENAPPPRSSIGHGIY